MTATDDPIRPAASSAAAPASPRIGQQEDGLPVSLRLAAEHDVPALQGLIADSMRALSAGHYTDRQIESALAHIVGVDCQLIADGSYYVAVAGDRIVGCGGWSRRKRLIGGDQPRHDGDEWLDPDRDPARIRALFVRPGWARRGIGRRLLAACEAAAAAAGFRDVELVATGAGEPLYAAAGYALAERFEIALPDGERLPVAHMRKPLPLLLGEPQSSGWGSVRRESPPVRVVAGRTRSGQGG